MMDRLYLSDHFDTVLPMQRATMLNIDCTIKDAVALIRYLDDIYLDYITNDCYQQGDWDDNIRHIAAAYIALCDACRGSGYDPKYYFTVKEELACEMPIVSIHAGEWIVDVINKYKDVPNAWAFINTQLKQAGLHIQPDGLIVEDA